MAAATGRPPLIGVTTSEIRRAERTDPLPEGEPPQHELALGMPYVRALERAGAVPVVLPPVDAGRARARRAARGRLPVRRAGSRPVRLRRARATRTSARRSPALDAFELEVARCADAAGLPILGICRGAQALNVARGGSLHQHLPRSRTTSAPPDRPGWVTTHDGRDRAATRGWPRILGATEQQVNSFHHQAVDRLGGGLHAVAWAPDGTVEAIEGDGERLVLGVQWHAETLEPASAREAVRALVAGEPGARRRGGRLSRVRLRRRAAPGGAPDRDALERMGAALAPRGPDGDGLWIGDGVGLVHRRLAIIDLSDAGAQPMRDGELTIVFNGCIYNHHELRARADARRATCSARTPTPRCCSRAGAQWGEELLDRLRGHVRVRACTTTAAAARCSSATGSAIKPLYLAELPAAGCARRRRCPRWSRPAASTRASTRSRCTTT